MRDVPKKQKSSHGADSFVSLLSVVSPDSKFLRVDCLPHPALWARLTAEGTEFFWIDTALSASQLAFERFDLEKLSSPKSRQSRSIQDWFGLLQEISQLSLVSELLKLFGAGLLPISMAAPLGEKESFVHRFFLMFVLRVRKKYLDTIAQRATATCCALCTVASWTTRQLGSKAGPTSSSTDSWLC
jgi:hypothetical protein